MRRQYKGNALSTTLSNLMNPGDTTAVLTDGSTFPDASIGPFVLTINPGGASEEKVLVAARSGNNLSSITRGYDGTTAGTHQSAEKVTHTLAALDLDEANAHVNSTAAHGLSGSVVGTTDAQTLTNKTLAAPVLTGVLSNSSLLALGGALSAYDPGLLIGGASPTATRNGRFLQLGKLFVFTIRCSVTATNGANGQVQFQVPLSYQAPDLSSAGIVGQYFYSNAGGSTFQGGIEKAQGASNINAKLLAPAGTSGSPYLSLTAAVGDLLYAWGWGESP